MRRSIPADSNAELAEAADTPGRMIVSGLPGFLFAEFSDVRDVMTAVPGVEKNQPVHGARAVFRMHQHPVVLIGSEGAQQANPAIVQCVE